MTHIGEMAGPIATSVFNQLGQYARSPGTGPLLCRTRRFFPNGGLSTKMVYPRTVSHPSTNRARRRATMLIKTNALPLIHAVIKAALLNGNAYVIVILGLLLCSRYIVRNQFCD